MASRGLDLPGYKGHSLIMAGSGDMLPHKVTGTAEQESQPKVRLRCSRRKPQALVASNQGLPVDTGF